MTYATMTSMTCIEITKTAFNTYSEKPSSDCSSITRKYQKMNRNLPLFCAENA